MRLAGCIHNNKDTPPFVSRIVHTAEERSAYSGKDFPTAAVAPSRKESERFKLPDVS